MAASGLRHFMWDLCCPSACGTLVPQLGIKPIFCIARPILNHPTPREGPHQFCLELAFAFLGFGSWFSFSCSCSPVSSPREFLCPPTPFPPSLLKQDLISNSLPSFRFMWVNVGESTSVPVGHFWLLPQYVAFPAYFSEVFMTRVLIPSSRQPRSGQQETLVPFALTNSPGAGQSRVPLLSTTRKERSVFFVFLSCESDTRLLCP